MQITARYPWATREIWQWLTDMENYADQGFTVTSLYRPRWYNTLVRGVWNSYHLKASAADLVPDDGDLKGLAETANVLAPRKGEVVIEPEKGIIHLEVEE